MIRLSQQGLLQDRLLDLGEDRLRQMDLIRLDEMALFVTSLGTQLLSPVGH